MGKARIMHDLTVKEIIDGLKETQTIILPVGIIEQHGYHLPVSVDIHNAVEIARRTADIAGCFVAPPVHYNFSGGTLPGTINISPQVFSLLLMDIVQSLSFQGFRKIVILLGHGGTESVTAARDAVHHFLRLRPEVEGLVITVVPFAQLSETYMKSIGDRDYHAGLYETSMMLYWKPELVKMNLLELDREDILEMMRENPDAYASPDKALDIRYEMPRYVQHPDIQVGVMGDPEGATPELGQTIAGECASSLAALIEEMEGRRHG